MADSIRFDPEVNFGARKGVGAWIEYAATRLALGGANRLPYAVQRALTGALARIAFRVDQRHTEAARTFLRQALGEGMGGAEEDRRIISAYQHIFRISLDADAFERRVSRDRRLDHYSVHRAPGLDEAIAAGRGGIVLTPHVGDWEAASAAMPHLGMKPAYAVARPPKNLYLSRHLLRVRESRRVTVMPRHGGMARAAQILREGGWIGMLLDQRPGLRNTIVPFFGRPAWCERGAAVLMRRMRVPIAISGCYLTDRPFHYELHFSRVVTPEELATLSVEEITLLINRETEKLILRRPEEYFWLHDRYRYAPPVEQKKLQKPQKNTE
jgi:Kdo2-lipid IVA lauroyltransferase/acyltransferase